MLASFSQLANFQVTSNTVIGQVHPCTSAAVTANIPLTPLSSQVRDAFALAKEKSPAIIFIDEIDAIGTKRFDSELSGDREVQRTMLELLNQLDGFGSEESIKV